MKALEKRDYIHSHLHLIDEKIINEVYRKIHSELEENNPVVGYNTSGEPIKKQQLLADLLDAEKQIEKGEYMTLDELDEDSKTW
jgi:hypothetical protein